MKFAEARPGRVFILRLEDGEILHESVERFAREHGIKSAALIALGGADTGSRLVVGPAADRAKPVDPMECVLDGVHELSGTGTLFPDVQGRPILHMHAACGRKDQAKAGCVRRGVKVWHVMEIVMHELTGTSSRRVLDTETGFELLEP